jgi:hypothetical protein
MSDCVLASLEPGARFSALMRGELRRPAEADPALLGPHHSFAAAASDQLTLELGKTSKHRDDQPTVGVGGVGPGVAQGAKARTALGDRVEQVKQVTCASRQPVEARDRQHIPRLQLVDDLEQLGALRLRPGYLLAVQLGGTRRPEFILLR